MTLHLLAKSKSKRDCIQITGHLGGLSVPSNYPCLSPAADPCFMSSPSACFMSASMSKCKFSIEKKMAMSCVALHKRNLCPKNIFFAVWLVTCDLPLLKTKGTSSDPTDISLEIKLMWDLMSWDVFVCPWRALAVHRDPPVLFAISHMTVNDYPCSQRQEEESLPHGREIEETFPFHPSPKCRTLSQQPSHISVLYSFLCYHQVSVRAPPARTFLLQVQVFTMAHLPHIL